MLPRCLGWRKQKRDDHTLSFADELAKTASESIEAVVRKRRILFAGFVARMGEERLPQRVTFGDLVGGKSFSGRQEEKDLMVHPKEEMLASGMKFEGWQKAAQKAGRWFRRVEKGARKLYDAKRRRAAERYAIAAAAPSTVNTSKRSGGGGMGGDGGGGDRGWRWGCGRGGGGWGAS